MHKLFFLIAFVDRTFSVTDSTEVHGFPFLHTIHSLVWLYAIAVKETLCFTGKILLSCVATS